MTSEKKAEPLFKKMKGQDRFQQWALDQLAKITQKPQRVVGWVVLMLLGVLAVYGVREWSEAQALKIQEELGTIDKKYRDETKGYAEKVKVLREQVEILKKPAETTKAQGATGDEKGENKGLSEAEQKAQAEQASKREAEAKVLEEKIEAMEPDHKASVASFQQFYQKYPKEPEGMVAGLRYVGALLKESEKVEASEKAEKSSKVTGQKQEATQVLDAIIAGAEKLPLLQTQAQMMLLALQEDAKNHDIALKNVDILLAKVTDDLKPRLMLVKARILSAQNKANEATDLLDQVIKGYDSKPEADTARAYLAMIKQGV